MLQRFSPRLSGVACDNELITEMISHGKQGLPHLGRIRISAIDGNVATIGQQPIGIGIRYLEHCENNKGHNDFYHSDHDTGDNKSLIWAYAC